MPKDYPSVIQSPYHHRGISLISPKFGAFSYSSQIRVTAPSNSSVTDSPSLLSGPPSATNTPLKPQKKSTPFNVPSPLWLSRHRQKLTKTRKRTLKTNKNVLSLSLYLLKKRKEKKIDQEFLFLFQL